MNDDIQYHIKEYYSFWSKINNLYGKWAKEHDLSYHSLFVLYAIWDSKDNICTQKKICDDWLFPKQNVNSILKKFEEKNYILLQSLSKDKRHKEILLTDEGRHYADKIFVELYNLEEKVMKHMGETNRNNMTKNNTLFLNLFKEAMDEKSNL